MRAERGRSGAGPSCPAVLQRVQYGLLHRPVAGRPARQRLDAVHEGRVGELGGAAARDGTDQFEMAAVGREERGEGGVLLLYRVLTGLLRLAGGGQAGEAGQQQAVVQHGGSQQAELGGLALLAGICSRKCKHCH